jgi:phage terminase Nu1 subunit (DNA packaging protein)
VAELNPEDSPLEAPIELTQRQLARVLGCAPSSIVAWERDAGLPSLGDRGRERWYDAAVAVRWYVDRELARRGSGDPDRQRLLRARADRAELELLVRLGELTRVDEVQAAGRELGREVGAAFLALPAQVAGVLAGLAPEAIQTLLEAEVDKRISALADRLDAQAAEYDRRRAAAPDAKADIA